MRKNIVTAALCTALALTVAFAGIMLGISLLGRVDSPGTELWDTAFMLPRNVMVIVAPILLLTDIACIALLVILTVSAVRASRAAKAECAARRGKARFSRLKELDRRGGATQDAPFDDGVTLFSLNEDFRNFAAFNSGLYYDNKITRAYIAALSVTHLIILQGISGTGKTSLAYTFGKFIGRDAAVTPVQPSWKDRSDLIGYYNEFTDSYTETELLYRLYESNMSRDVFTVILDEMNISRVEYYFAEFLSLLELPDGESRRVRVTSDSRENDPALFVGGTLRLPDNVWFAGTANNDDSTLAISDKVYDRAFVIEINRRSTPFAAPETPRRHVSAERMKRLFEQARAENAISDKTLKKLYALDEYLMSSLRITFGNRVMRQIERFVPVYIACGGTEDEATDMMIRYKVLRKLDQLNPVYVRAEVEGLIRFINELFGPGAMTECLEYLNRYRYI